MMLGQSGAKKHAEQRATKDAREHDQADCDGIHGLNDPDESSRSLHAFLQLNQDVVERVEADQPEPGKL
jgi:hypothetical protein